MRTDNLKKSNRNRNRGGFTMIELIVVVVIVMILAGGLVFGIMKWVQWTQFKKQNEYAQTLFVAAQNQLTEYSTSGQLHNLQEVFSDDQEVDLSTLLDSEGTAYNLSEVWPQSGVDGESNVSRYRDTVVSAIGTAEDYANYQNGTADEKTKALYDLFSTYLYDPSILNATICVEFTPDDGQVFAVLYSDIDKEFEYNTDNIEHRGTVDITSRQTAYRRERMVGYYGVDSLYKATSTKVEKPSISNVKLNNEDTLNLTFNLSKIKNATGDLTYEIIIRDKISKDALFSFKIGGSGLNALANKNAKKQMQCVVTRYNYDEAHKQTEQELGTYPILAWIGSDQNKTVHVILDAVDESATTDLYYDAYESLMSKTAPIGENNDLKLLQSSFSFHRFGVNAKDIYCTVQGRGAIYKTTAVKTSNSENAYYASEIETTKDDQTEATYTINNMRHLSNIRYLEDYSDEERTGGHNGLATADTVVYQMTDNIDWYKFVENGSLFKTTGITNGVPVITVADGTDDNDVPGFVSIKQLRENATFECVSKNKIYSIKHMRLSEEDNKEAILYGRNEDKTAKDGSTGLFLKNEGTIQNVAMDSVCVTGIDTVGAFCGENNGTLQNLTVANSDSKHPSTITGEKYVGGVVGAESKSPVNTDPESNPKVKQIIYDSLTNRSSVTGIECVGGIVGKLESDAQKSIQVTKCNNYGQVEGTVNADKNVVSKCIGGVVGYAHKVNKTLEITECASSPYYENGSDIIKTEESLKRKLNGVFVGGIVGYNDMASIHECNTKKESGKQGYIFGQKYVGGIVGYNAISDENATGDITGSDARSVNEVNVIGESYVGGIVGCNAGATATPGATKAQLFTDGTTDPVIGSQSNSMLSNWINKGIVAATSEYAGGIAGFNTGIIENCSNEEEDNEVAKTLQASKAMKGSYVGGIAGYNNGQIISADPEETEKPEVINIVSFIIGKDYLGGIVGYNDASAIIDDMAVTGGKVIGSGCFVGGYAGVNTSTDLVSEEKNLVSNPKNVEGTYCVGGTFGGNIVKNADNKNISAVFSADNFLGTLKATAFAGGFIGYNKLLKNETEIVIKNKVDEATKALSVDEMNITSAIEVIKKIDGLDASGARFTIHGKTDDESNSSSTQARFGGITADIYVAGVIGCNSENTKLTIENVVNKSPITAKQSIENSAEQGEEKVPYTAKDDSSKKFAYSYVGGIIGKVTNDTTLNNCSNQEGGSVNTKGTYLGGLCEINEGQVQNCTVSSTGTSDHDYVGGIAGLNKNGATISNSIFSGKTVVGQNYVGGIAAENYGTIEGTFVSDASVTAVSQVGTMIGCSYSGSELKIGNNSDKTMNITLSASGEDVGGLIGVNGGIITVAENVKPVVSGMISGDKNVGGIVGRNTDGNIDGFTNEASVTATNGAVGGIVGVSDSEMTIVACINKGNISATTSGNAGGIIGDNVLILNIGENNESQTGGTVRECTNQASVSAANGTGGGIAGTNAGTIQSCHVSQNEKKEVSITGQKDLGGVCGVNYNTGTVLDTNIGSGVKLQNQSSSAGYTLGGIVGKNSGTITSCNVGTAEDMVEIKSSSAKINLGGIVGLNEGTISGVKEKYSTVYASMGFQDRDMAYYGNIGGIAGENKSTDTGNASIQYCEFNGVVEGTANNPQDAPTYDPNKDFEGSVIYGYGGIAGVNGDSQRSNHATISYCRTNSAEITGIGDANNIVNLGGISGVNGAGAVIKYSTVGNSEGKQYRINTTNNSQKDAAVYVGINQNNKSNEKYVPKYADSYAFVGGISGLNSGTIKNINYVDNNDYSQVDSTSVIVANNRGHAGGIIGYNRRIGRVNQVVTGNDWLVYTDKNAQDNGCGGIIGYQSSEYGMSECINRANVEKVASGSNGVGGMIGRLEVATSSTWSIFKCKNYGNISAVNRAGGMVGVWKYYGASIDECVNYGKVIASSSEGCAGIVGSFYGIKSGDVVISDCENHGRIYSSKSGGIVGTTVHQSTSGMTLKIYNCVNTGLISANASSGGILGNLAVSVSTESIVSDCKNYGYGIDTNGKVSTAIAGIAADGNGITVKNCFGIAKTDYPISSSKGDSTDYYIGTGESGESDSVTTYSGDGKTIISTAGNYNTKSFYVKSIEAKNITNPDHLWKIVNNNTKADIDDGSRAYYSVNSTGTLSNMAYVFTFSTGIDLSQVVTYWNRGSDDRTQDYKIYYSNYTSGDDWYKFGEVTSATDKQYKTDQYTPDEVDTNDSSISNVRRIKIDITKSITSGNKTANACLIRAYFNGKISSETNCEYAGLKPDNTNKYQFGDANGYAKYTGSIPAYCNYLNSAEITNSKSGTLVTFSGLEYQTKINSTSTDEGVGKGTKTTVNAIEGSDTFKLTNNTKTVGYPGFSLDPYAQFENAKVNGSLSNENISTEGDGDDLNNNIRYRVFLKDNRYFKANVTENLTSLETPVINSVESSGDTSKSMLIVKWNNVPYATYYRLIAKYYSNNELIGTYEGKSFSTSMQIPTAVDSEQAADKIHIQVQACTKIVDPDGKDTELKSSFSKVMIYTLNAVLPTPQYHVELIYDNGKLKYYGILDNRDEFLQFLRKQHIEESNLEQTLGTIKITITNNNSNWITFNAKDGDSRSNLVNGKDWQTQYFVTAIATADGYTSSAVTYRETPAPTEAQYLGSTQIANVSLAPKTSNNDIGFKGTTLDTLSYQLKMSPNSVVLYMRSEMMAQDQKLGIPVSLSNSTFRVSTISSAEVAVQLNGLPADLLDTNKYTDLLVRSYPSAMTNNVVYQGHSVDLQGLTEGQNTGITADKLKDLYVTAGHQVTTDSSKGTKLITENNGQSNLASGFVVELAKDGTYTLYYNALIDYNEQQDYNYDKDTSTSLARNAQVFYYHLQSAISNIQIQSAPVINVNNTKEDGKYSTEDGDVNVDQWNINWDEPEYTDSSFNGHYKVGAVYDYLLTGTTLKGDSAQIDAGIYTTEKDKDNSLSPYNTITWQYNHVDVRITRRGEADSKGMTTTFPATSNLPIDLKQRFTQITIPNVTLHKEGEDVQKNSLLYDVSWTNLPETERTYKVSGSDVYELADYEVTVKPAASDSANTENSLTEEEKVKRLDTLEKLYGGKGATKSETDSTISYTWQENSTDGAAEPYTVTKTVKITTTKAEDSTWSITKELTEKWIFTPLDSDRTTSTVMKMLDLNDYDRGEVLAISVRGIAAENASVYRDGSAGVERELTLPNRLDVPDVSKLASSPSYDRNKAITIGEYENGLALTLKDTAVSTVVQGRYQLAVAVYDKKGTEDYTKVTAGDVDNGWSSGSTTVLLAKGSETPMSGNLSDASYQLNLSSTEYAGKWLKVALRSVSENNISSYWSDEDETQDGTLNYQWIQIPRVQVATPDLREGAKTLFYESNSTVGKGGYIWNKSIDQTEVKEGEVSVKQKSLTFNKSDYANAYQLQIIRNQKKTDISSDVQYTIQYLDWIYLELAGNGTDYNVFYTTTNPSYIYTRTDYQRETDSIIECQTNSSAMYIGTITKSNTDQSYCIIPYSEDADIGDSDNLLHLTSYIRWMTASDSLEERFEVVLPDAEEIAINNESLSVDCTSQVSANALVLNLNRENTEIENLQERYADSKISNWYMEADNQTAHVITLDQYMDAPDSPNEFTLSTSEILGVSYEIKATARNWLVYQIELTQDNMVFTYKYVSANGEGLTDIQTIALLNETDYKEYEGANIRIRYAAIEKGSNRTEAISGGLSKWSEWVSLGTLPTIDENALGVSQRNDSMQMMLDGPSQDNLTGNAVIYQWKKDDTVENYTVSVNKQIITVNNPITETSISDSSSQTIVAEQSEEDSGTHTLSAQATLNLENDIYTLTVPSTTSLTINGQNVEFKFYLPVQITAESKLDGVEPVTYSSN